MRKIFDIANANNYVALSPVLKSAVTVDFDVLQRGVSASLMRADDDFVDKSSPAYQLQYAQEREVFLHKDKQQRESRLRHIEAKLRDMEAEQEALASKILEQKCLLSIHQDLACEGAELEQGKRNKKLARAYLNYTERNIKEQMKAKRKAIADGKLVLDERVAQNMLMEYTATAGGRRPTKVNIPYDISQRKKKPLVLGGAVGAKRLPVLEGAMARAQIEDAVAERNGIDITETDDEDDDYDPDDKGKDLEGFIVKD